MGSNQFCPVLALAWLIVTSSTPGAAQTLKEAVEQAVRTNPEVRATANRRRAADEALKQARGGYFPRIDLNAGYGRERLDNADTRFLRLDNENFSRHDAGLTLTQMLFDGFAVKSEVARQQARVDSSAYGVAATGEDIALRAVGAYLEVLRRQETVAAAVDNLNAHQRIHDLIKLRSHSGVGRRADLYQAQGRLALAKANLEDEQSNLRDARISFLRIVGVPSQRLTEPAPPKRALPSGEKAALRLAVDNHPALKSAEADVIAAQAQHESAKAALSPRLDFELGASRGDDKVSGIANERTAMLRLRYNLSRGGSDLARVNETRYLIQEASEALNRTRRQVEENLSLAFNAYLTARQRLFTLKQYTESSGATREAYAKQFSIGQRTLLDLLNAENEYFAARTSYVTGKYTELAGLYRALAGMGLLLNTLQVTLPAEAIQGRGEKRLHSNNSKH